MAKLRQVGPLGFFVVVAGFLVVVAGFLVEVAGLLVVVLGALVVVLGACLVMLGLTVPDRVGNGEIGAGWVPQGYPQLTRGPDVLVGVDVAGNRVKLRVGRSHGYPQLIRGSDDEVTGTVT